MRSRLFRAFAWTARRVASSPLVRLQRVPWLVRAYYRAYDKLAPDVVEHRGVRFRRDAGLGTGATMGFHEPFMMEVFESLLRPDSRVVDVGAFVGSYALLAATRAPRGEVVALEPAAGTHRRLLDNVGLNAAANVRVVRAAAGAAPGRASFFVPQGGAMAASLYGAGEREEVDVVRLDDLVRAPVDILKIDAEGAELEVLEGAGRLLSESPRLALFVEFAPAALERRGIDERAFLARLREGGFDAYLLDEDARRVVLAPDVDALMPACARHGHVNLLLQRTSAAPAPGGAARPGEP